VHEILIVDDDADTRFLLKNLLEAEGYSTLCVHDGTRAIRRLKKRLYDLVLLDMKLPDKDGIAVLEEIKGIDGNMLVIAMTAYGEIRDAVKVMKLGAFDYITKPFDGEQLLIVIKRALETQSLSREVERLRRRLREKGGRDRVMGESPAIEQVVKQVSIVAPTNMTVIIQGPSGSGKEVIANMIHENSVRKGKAFVAIDCGAVPETLVESELFGHERGAFTGADRKREGAFEQAVGGTLFLDEISNLPDTTQAKLLRAIETREVRPLGSRKTMGVDVRVVAASVVDLARAVRARKFKAELFHRLNQFSMDIPTLNERKEDIPILAEHFREEANQELGKKTKRITGSAMKLLLSYSWPGNVRELKNTIKRAVLLAESSEIAAVHLNGISGDARNFSAGLFEKGGSFDEMTKSVQRDLIRKALGETGGNRERASEFLGMNRKALYRKMKSLDLL